MRERRDPVTGQIIIEAGGGNDHIKVSDRYDEEGNRDGVDVLAYDERGRVRERKSYTDEQMTEQGLSIKGGDGDDQIDASSSGYDLQIDGGRGDDVLSGGEGLDMIAGGAGNDRIFGNGGIDVVDGGKGADQIFGGDGDDYLEGGQGNDYIRGGAGADSQFGNSGVDHIDGNSDEDQDISPGNTTGDSANLIDGLTGVFD